jgi:hypothetical protein
MRTKAVKPRHQLDNGFDQRVTRDRVAEFTGAFEQDNAAAGHATTRDTRVNAATIQKAGAPTCSSPCFVCVVVESVLTQGCAANSQK